MILNSLTGKSLSTIRLFPPVTGAFDASKAPKDWSMPVDCHTYDTPDDPDFVTFDIIQVVNGLPLFARKTFSRETAVASNPKPSSYTYMTGQAVLPSVAQPIDKTKIPDGYELGTIFPGNPGLVPSGQNQSPQVGFTQADHQMLVDILSFVRK